MLAVAYHPFSANQTGNALDATECLARETELPTIQRISPKLQPVRSITLPECRQNENTGTARNVSIANKPAECSNSPELPPRGLPPLVSALKASAEQNTASFHFPGHNRGHAAPASMTQLIGIRPYVHDLPELPELDNLFCPQGPILEAQKEAAKLFGSSHTWFLVGGTTCGIHATIMATCSPGDYLILPRNCHVSAISAMVLSGAVPKYIVPDCKNDWDLPGGVTPLQISEICHSGKIPLIVDEAHGAHLGFHPKLPRSALQQGADLTVQSTHKAESRRMKRVLVQLKFHQTWVLPLRLLLPHRWSLQWRHYPLNIANMVLFTAKVYASIRSGSLAIIASTLDSLLDLLSGFILWFTAFSMQTPNPYQYPIGKNRMQPLGILVFASVMATLGLQIILESVRTLIYTDNNFYLTRDQECWVMGIMLSVTLVKFMLMIYCRSFTNEIVKAYAQDHFFDVITNLIGLIAALLANYFDDWMDPVGAIILALYTIRTWSMTVLENVSSLVGRSAAPEYL
ncbi:hypothetical protein KIW84_010745 [Lathyrus oleraceus]|uniref:Uncharacterized protein n=2 Tax=Pisum sativum TaxID=3888 RepID=A0A9D4YPV5_PEA|nr:hypothetical protein KIW84_010745 [Pisum sativum]